MARKVKAFLHKLFNSTVPQNTYYAHIIKQKIRPSIYYYLVLIAISSLLTIGAMLIQINENSPAKISQCMQYSLKSIPEDFTLHVQDGLLSTNQLLPLFVWFNCDNRLHLLAVVDQRANKNDVFSYNAQVLATSSELVARYKNYVYSFPYKKYITELRASKSTIVSLIFQGIDTMKSYYPLVTAIVLVLTPLFFIFTNITILLLSSLAVYIFFRLLKRHYYYKTIIHVGMHSSTLPIMILLLFVIYPVNVINSLTLLFFLIFIFQLVGVYEAHYSEASAHHK